MKNLVIACAATLLLGTVAASADILNAPYVSVLGGWSSHPALSIGGGRADLDDGYNVGARAGTYIGGIPGVSLDADFFYNRSGYSGTNATLNSSSYMADLMYHVPTNSPWGIYGGAGLGVVNDNLTVDLHGSSAVLGWQAIGGVDYSLNEMSSLFAEYRYQNAHDANVGSTPGVGNTSNNVSVGVKFNM